jgi:cytochrome c-type protein NapC
VRAALLLVLGACFGAAALVGTDVAVRATGTEAFCTSCHEMTIPQKEYAESSHYLNRSGVRASCGDCHIPHDYPAKLVHKTYAGVKDIIQHMRGVIDTPEKFEAHRAAMAQTEWARMKANGSAECRHCHDAGAMDPAKQKAFARAEHEKARTGNLSCVECHKGVAHREPGAARPVEAAGNFDTDAMLRLHKKNNCYSCHAVEDKKKGPPYKVTAAKYKGKPEAEAALVKKVLSGGEGKPHPEVEADPKDVEQLVRWILSL